MPLQLKSLSASLLVSAAIASTPALAAKWTLYPDLKGVKGSVIEADSLEVSPTGALIFRKIVAGKPEVSQVVSPHSYGTVIRAD